jgi:hypothetical protein
MYQIFLFAVAGWLGAFLYPFYKKDLESAPRFMRPVLLVVWTIIIAGVFAYLSSPAFLSTTPIN